MTSTQAARPRSARRDRIRLLVACTSVVLAGAGVLAGCATLGPAMATPVVTSVQGPLPIVSVEAALVVETAELPAEGLAPSALPDLRDSFSVDAIAGVAPVVEAAPAEAAPAEVPDDIEVEYAGKKGAAEAESAPVAPSNGDSGHGVDYYYSLDGYAGTTSWGQVLIDACTGGVTEMGSYTTDGGAPRTFAIHSHCGGDAITYAPLGTSVAIGGEVYIVGEIVARLSMYENTADEIPKGYDALFQSCYNGAADMAFRSLTLVRG